MRCFTAKKKSIFLALMIGQQPNRLDPDRILLVKTGTIHLLTISGLHLNMLAGSIFYCSCFVWRKFAPERWLQNIPTSIFAAWISIIAILVYVNFLGCNIPLIRGSIMLIGYYLGSIYRIFRSNQDYYLLGLLLILLDPFNTLKDSFWLSFLATGTLFLQHTTNKTQKLTKYNILTRISNYIKNNFTNNAMIFFGLLPINSYFFGKIYPVSLLANMIVIPLITVFIMPLIFLTLLLILCGFGINEHLILLIDNNLIIFSKILSILDKFSALSINIKICRPLQLLLILYSSFAILLAYNFLPKIKYLILIFPLIFTPKQKIPNGGAVINILDVGQGLGTVISLKNHVIIYDVGPNNGIVANYLNVANISNIDLLIISHTDQDHIGGLTTLVAQNRIKKFYTNIADYQTLGLTADLCTSNLSWEIDGVKFKFLSNKNVPNKLNRSNNTKNDASCVLKIIGEGYSMLYPGDISKKAEKYLLSLHHEELKSEVLVVPHHGSSSSSSEDFIAAVAPIYAIVSAGYLNSYHHPSPKVIARYLQHKIKVFNTAVHGSITIKLMPNSYLNKYYPTNIKVEVIPEQVNFWNY